MYKINQISCHKQAVFFPMLVLGFLNARNYFKAF